MRLKHRTQRGGEIAHSGPPLRPGEKVRLPVDEHGHFEAPDELGRTLVRILHPNVEIVPEKGRKEADR